MKAFHGRNRIAGEGTGYAGQKTKCPAALVCDSKVVDGHSDVLRKRSTSFAVCCPELAGKEHSLAGDPVGPDNHPGFAANGSRLLEDECRLLDEGFACLTSGCPVVDNGCRRLDNGRRVLDNGSRLVEIRWLHLKARQSWLPAPQSWLPAPQSYLNSRGWPLDCSE